MQPDHSPDPHQHLHPDQDPDPGPDQGKGNPGMTLVIIGEEKYVDLWIK